MKISKIRVEENALGLEIDGVFHWVTYHSETFWRQQIVPVHYTCPAGGPQAYLNNPDDEESALCKIPNAIRNRELADFHRDWKLGKHPMGDYPVSIELA